MCRKAPYAVICGDRDPGRQRRDPAPHPTARPALPRRPQSGDRQRAGPRETQHQAKRPATRAPQLGAPGLLPRPRRPRTPPCCLGALASPPRPHRSPRRVCGRSPGRPYADAARTRFPDRVSHWVPRGRLRALGRARPEGSLGAGGAGPAPRCRESWGGGAVTPRAKCSPATTACSRAACPRGPGPRAEGPQGDGFEVGAAAV